MKFQEPERKVELLLPNLSPEGRMLVELFMPFCRELHEENERLRAENKYLRNQLAQNSRNSSKPPSPDLHRPVKRDSGREGPKRNAGGEKDHAGQGGKLKDHPDKIIPCKLGDCPQCGEDLRQAPLDEVIRKQIEPFVDALRQNLKAAPSAHFDETGIKVGGDNHWVHVVSTKILTYFHINRNRGQKAHDSIGILPAFSGILHQDAYRSYDGYPQCRDSLCCAHILRELEFAIQRDGQQAWAKPMIALLLSIKKQVDARKEAMVSKKWQKDYRRQYRELIQKGLQSNPPTQRPDGQQRVATKQSKTYNLLIRLRDREEDILRLMVEPLAEFTNNQAERDLRINKVRAKVSGGFRAIAPAEEFMRIRSLISTAVKQSLCPLQTLIRVFTPGNTEFVTLG